MPRRQKTDNPEGQPSDAGPIPAPPARRRRFARVRKQVEYEAPVEEVSGEGNGQQPEEVAPDGAENQFAELLQNPRYQAIVERDDPVEWEGVKCEGEVKKFKLPKNWQDIVDFTGSHYGGRKYRVEIRNPRNGEVIAARQFEVEADPILPEGPSDDQVAQRMFDEYREKEDADPVRVLERQTLLAQKEAELERTQQALEAARERRKQSQGNAAVDTRIVELERKLETNKLEARLLVLEKENQELKERQQKALAAPKREGESDMMLLIREMRDDRRASDLRWDRMMAQMKDDKLDAMMQKLDAIQQHKTASPGGNALREQVSMLKDLAETFGLNLRGGRDEEEDDDDENNEWYAILVKKHLPRVLDLIENRKNSGQAVTKEEFVAQMQTAAKQAEDEAVAAAKARIAALQQQPPAQLPPATQTTQPAPTATTSTTQPAVQPPSAPAAPSVEDEKKLRVGAIFAGLERELEFRPKSYSWNAAAWDALPEEFLEKMCTAPDPSMMLAVFDGIVLPEKVEALRTKIGTNERAKAWVQRGLDELREGWAQSLKDPNHDPFADDEENESE